MNTAVIDPSQTDLVQIAASGAMKDLVVFGGKSEARIWYGVEALAGISSDLHALT